MPGNVQKNDRLAGGSKKVFSGLLPDRSPPKITQKVPKWDFFLMGGFKMARPREPIDFVVAKGRKHLTKAEYSSRKKSEITASADNIKPPSFLSKKERERFNEIAGQLLDIGIMTNLDCDILARYIRAVTEYEKVTKRINKIKFVPDKKKWTTEEEQFAEQTAEYNYLQKIQSRIEKQCNADARELGLTISSRCKLVMPKTKEEKPVNKFMQHAQ